MLIFLLTLGLGCGDDASPRDGGGVPDVGVDAGMPDAGADTGCPVARERVDAGQWWCFNVACEVGTESCCLMTPDFVCRPYSCFPRSGPSSACLETPVECLRSDLHGVVGCNPGDRCCYSSARGFHCAPECGDDAGIVCTEDSDCPDGLCCVGTLEGDPFCVTDCSR